MVRAVMVLAAPQGLVFQAILIMVEQEAQVVEEIAYITAAERQAAFSQVFRALAEEGLEMARCALFGVQESRFLAMRLYKVLYDYLYPC